MPDSAVTGLNQLETVLLGGITVLSTAVGTLFWQLLKANAREVDAYKTCAPLVQRLVDLCEKLKDIVHREHRGGSP